MSRMSRHCHRTLPLLADIHEQNVAFVVSALGSEPSNLCSLKELLIKTLFSLASKSSDSMFNIVSCGSKVLKWQTGLMECSLTNVTEAAAWIRALQVNSRDGVLNAVAGALEDPTCQAVYLFTSGVPEWSVLEIYSHLKETEDVRPVHTVYLVGNGEESQNSSQKILKKVAMASGGSFQAIGLNSGGASDEDIPDCTAGIHHSDCISKEHWSPLLTGHYTTQFPLGVWSPDSPNTFLRSSVKEDLADSSPKIHSLLRGIRVLARKETDGYYYLGHIVQEVKGSRDCVLIEFERSQRSREGKAQLRMQETALYDVIHYEDARRQPLAPGDGILAPWEKKGERYGPGTVLQVAETGSPHSAFKSSQVLVNFWNGQTKKVSADVAVLYRRAGCWRFEHFLKRLRFQINIFIRFMVKEAPRDSPREADVNTARTEFKRQKWEQRRLKEDQQRQEEHLKGELLLASKRQRSLQRTLQGVQKQQEDRGRAGLHAEQLRTARAERRRQASCLHEEDRNKENQRLDYLKAQRKQRETWLTEHNQTIDDHEKKRLELLRNKKHSMQKALEAALQEQDMQTKEKAAARPQTFQKWERMCQQVEKEQQKHKDLQQYLREQNLLTLRASLLA
ncbi:uncharacterized protein LOC134403987 [Elgaria multicarinata webbii]|uniref:uncharacterized protein LOC134403987 n=1 Tax=Elgaria multicarinata webbii TaxID=159646 RepID=UPI002FCCED77